MGSGTARRAADAALYHLSRWAAGVMLDPMAPPRLRAALALSWAMGRVAYDAPRRALLVSLGLAGHREAAPLILN